MVPKDGGYLSGTEAWKLERRTMGTKIFLSGMSYPTTDEAKIFCHPFPNRKLKSDRALWGADGWLLITAGLPPFYAAPGSENPEQKRGPGFSCLALGTQSGFQGCLAPASPFWGSPLPKRGHRTEKGKAALLKFQEGSLWTTGSFQGLIFSQSPIRTGSCSCPSTAPALQ